MSLSEKQFILNLIARHRNSPCLWQVTHEDYYKKHKRNAALNELLTLFKTVDENANIDTVKKKLASLKNCYRKELNKVKSSSISGKAEIDIHIPKLWYFNEMSYLVDIDPLQTSSISDDENQSMEVQSPRPLDEPSLISVDVPSISPKRSRKLANSLKRTKNQASALLLAKLSKRMNALPQQATPAPKLNFTAYGEHVAERLRCMPAYMATYCQKVINDAIFMAETNALDGNSQILNIDRNSAATSVNEHNRIGVNCKEERIYIGQFQSE